MLNCSSRAIAIYILKRKFETSPFFIKSNDYYYGPLFIVNLIDEKCYLILLCVFLITSKVEDDLII